MNSQSHFNLYKTIGSRSVQAAVLATILFLAICGTPMNIQASSHMGDLFVADPTGPFAVVDNPASLMRSTSMSVRFGVDHGGSVGRQAGHVAYVEPDLGLGAGAFHYTQTLVQGQTHRQFAYTVARYAMPGIAYGVTVKRMTDSTKAWWGADIGATATLSGRLRGGIAIRNVLGHGNENPVRVTGNLMVDQSDSLSFALLATTIDLSAMESWHLGIGTQLRITEQMAVKAAAMADIDGGRPYLHGGFAYTSETFSVSATVEAKSRKEGRIAIGMGYHY